MERTPNRKAVESETQYKHNISKVKVDVSSAVHGLQPVVEQCTVLEASLGRKLKQHIAGVSNADALHRMLGDLAAALSSSPAQEDTRIAAIWESLADLCKVNPAWRQLFGSLVRTGSGGVAVQDDSCPPSCILSAAVQGVRRVARKRIECASLRPMLRVIANCCADNNLNRSMVVESSAVADLQTLIAADYELDVLLPTIYNVCSDFDEVACDRSGKPYKLPETLTEAGSTVEHNYLTKAEAKLSIQSFFNLHSRHYDDLGSVVADLLELASHAALFDISLILGADQMRHASEAKNLCKDILSKGQQIACTDVDARASICQTCMNLFSSPIMQQALAISESAILRLVNLAYPGLDQFEDDEIDLFRYQRSFLTLVYTISASPEYAERMTVPSLEVMELVDSLASYDPGADSRRTAAVLVLINNALTSSTRINDFLRQYPKVSVYLKDILLQTKNEAITLPALNLAARVALYQPGAEALHKADPTFVVIPHVIASTSPSALAQLPYKPEYTLGVQHDLPVLARLIIKSVPTSTSALITNPAYTTLLSLSSTTIDPSFKLDTAHLIIQILRNIASSAENTQELASQAFSLPEPSTQAISSLVFLLINSPTPTSQSEALFGLSLLASLLIAPASGYHVPTVRNILLSALQRDQAKAISVLKRVAETKGQGRSKGDYANLKALLAHLAMSDEKTSNGNIDRQGEDTVPIDEQASVLRDLRSIARDMGI